jgi:1-acyl-sn-glycerol-3-phosphate acyltransferase
VVDQIADHYNEHADLIIAIAPEGTRKKTDHWKSGFYHIANKARVPLLLGYVDYVNKRAGTGPSFVPTGDIKKDMDRIRDFYQDIRGDHPEFESDIILREERK